MDHVLYLSLQVPKNCGCSWKPPVAGCLLWVLLCSLSHLWSHRSCRCADHSLGWKLPLRYDRQYSKGRIPSPSCWASGSQKSSRPMAGPFSESSLRVQAVGLAARVLIPHLLKGWEYLKYCTTFPTLIRLISKPWFHPEKNNFWHSFC